MDETSVIRVIVEMSGELKDLAKTLVGIYSGILAFLVTFSDKIVDFKTANRTSVACMYAS